MLLSLVSSWCFQKMLGLDWKVIASHKHSSLFGHIISNEGKKFYNNDTLFLKMLRCLSYHSKNTQRMIARNCNSFVISLLEKLTGKYT